MEYPNWFGHYAQSFFEKHLAHLAGRPGLRFLQIGAFTGDASVWLLDNILTGEGAHLTDVDTWEGSDEPEHEAFDWAEVERVYDDRMRQYAGHVWKFKDASESFFSLATVGYDFAYIDGDHAAGAVLSDGINACRRLKPGGLIAFDDYLWKSGKGPYYDPAGGIDTFAEKFADNLELVETGLQVWFRKTA